MQRNSQRLFPVDANERRELAQLFCLALRNVQAYGIEHTVSATTLRGFYDRLIGLLDRYPEIAWSFVDGKILLNGESCELRTADDVLANRMKACGLETFSFLDSISRIELTRFVLWLATGVDSMQSGEAYVGVRIADSVYARISRDELENASGSGAGEATDGGGGAKGKAASAGVKQFDLDSMLTDAFDGTGGGAGFGEKPSYDMKDQFSRFVAQQRAADDQRKELLLHIQKVSSDPQALATLQEQFLATGGRPDEWDQLCWQAENLLSSQGATAEKRAEQILKLQEDLDALQKRCAMGQFDPETVVNALGELRGSLDGLMHTVHEHADSLVEKVNADRKHVAELEKAARESGAPIHLSREELLESLAEINQELAQPLTVSSALVELLSSGRFGEVDEKQQEVFDLASSSLKRLEVVVKYLQRLSGMPINLAPNQELLSEVYGGGTLN